MLDLRIDQARLFDGESFRNERCVGIKDGRIVNIGDPAAPAETVINAAGRLLTPAFVDTHSHADFAVTHDDNDGGSSISQGIGTLVVGNCGMSSTPVTEPFPLLFHKKNDRNLDLADHLQRMASGLSVNVAELLGHNTLRMSVLGEAREAKTREIAIMCSMLDDFLSAGWSGLSVGLNYPEAAGYSRQELLELAKVLAGFGRPLTCHIRDQRYGILEAMDEVIDIGAEAECRVLVSHLRPLRTTGEPTLIPQIERRFDQNDHAHFDLYPYVAGCTTLQLFWDILFDDEPRPRSSFSSAEVDAAVLEACAGGYDDIHIVQHANSDLSGKTVSDVAVNTGGEPAQTIQSVYFDDPDCICIFDNTSLPNDVDRLMQHDRCLIGSDAWLFPVNYAGACHPRNFGAFTGFLTRYVREGSIDLESGLRRITSQAADYFSLEAGRIALGGRADIALFSLDELNENADTRHPYRLSTGMAGLWISGQCVFGDYATEATRAGARLQASRQHRCPQC